MKSPQTCRLMLFALLSIGLALILLGSVVPALVPFQAQSWLSAEEQAELQTRESVERVLRRVDRGIQLGLFALGGLIVVFSVIGIWSYPLAANPRSDAAFATKGACTNNHGRLPRVLAFSLMFFGLILSLLGNSAEINSFRDTPSTSAEFMSLEGRSREREQAYILKNVGVALVVAGAMVLVVGGWLLTRSNRTEAGAAHKPSRAS